MRARSAAAAVLAVPAVLLSLSVRSVAAPPATTYKVDKIHSAALFRVKHMGAGNTYGRFNDFGGTLVVDDDGAKSSLEVEIKVDSVDTNAPDRDKHLKTPDFFNEKEFPKITFKSKEVKKAGDGYEVTGDLTIHGVTKSVTTHVVQVGSAKNPKGDRIGFETVFTIKRSDYGMTGMQQAVGDEVQITFALEGVTGQ